MPSSSTLEKKQQSNAYHAYLICFLAFSYYIYDYFIQVAPSVMTHRLMHDFRTDAAGLGILNACFFYSYTLMQIPTGLLLDRFGARRLLTVTTLISATGVVLSAMSHNLVFAGFARFLIGLGSASAFVSAIYLISNWFSYRHFTILAGLLQFSGCLGSIFGQSPMAYTINHYGWRHTLFDTGIFTFMLAGVFWLVIRDGKPLVNHTRLTLRNEWQHFRQIFRFPQIKWLSLCSFVCWVPAATVGALWGVPYLMAVYHWSNVTAGQALTVFWLGVGFSGPILGWLTDRLQRRRDILIFCFSCGLICSSIFIAAPLLPPVITLLALAGIGVSAAIQALSFGFLKDLVPSEFFGAATGLINMLAILGGGLGQPVMGFILNWQWRGRMLDGTPVYDAHAFQIALLILPLAAIIGLLTTCFKLKETHCQKQYGNSTNIS